jgi:hypothetical protein
MTSNAGDDLVLDFLLGRDGTRLTVGTAVGLTFVGCLCLAAMDAIGLLKGEIAFGGFVLLVVVMSWWSAPVTSMAVALLAFAFANGFAFDTKGTLSWHGEADLVRLSLMVLLALTVSVIGYRRADFSRRSRILGAVTARTRHW